MRIVPPRVKIFDLATYAKSDIVIRELPKKTPEVDCQAVTKSIEDYIPKLNRIKGSNEYGAIITPSGEIFDIIKGEEISVSTAHSIILPNDSFLHRHPIICKPSKISAYTLSPPDLRCFILNKLHREDAVDKSGGHYFMRRTPESLQFGEKRIKTALEFIDDAEATFHKKVKCGYLETNKEANNFFKMYWNQFADLFHFEYFHHEGQLSLVDRTKMAVAKFIEIFE